MRALTNRRILLGVTGGIACYKAASLARLLAQAGAEVDVVMTRSALEFVGRTTFQALTGRDVHTDLFGTGHALDHIRLAQRAELIIIAPASADFMARMAQGRANDLLAACVLARRSPILLAPAMNDHMWKQDATQRNVDVLARDAVHFVGPVAGALAAGEGEGPGRMSEPDVIAAHAARILGGESPLRGVTVTVTAGATREAIDPVRFISNASSGKMGIAIARAAWERGADVTLIAGSMTAEPPHGAKVVRVGSTQEMCAAVDAELAQSRVLIMAAAPADFRPASPATQKMKKEADIPRIDLERTPDILLTTASSRTRGSVVVGFALETANLRENAIRKLHAKQLDLIVANDASEAGAGFGVDTNRVTLIRADGTVAELPLLPKSEVAEHILDEVEALLHARS